MKNLPPFEQSTKTPTTRPLYWAVALLLGGILLYFALRGLDWRQVCAILSRTNPVFVGVSLLIASFSLLCRAIRWRILLRAGTVVKLPTAFWATSAGYFGNSFLPARAGEIVRTLMISARTGLSKTFVLTTALAERLSDAVTLVFISSIVLLTLTVKPGWFGQAAKPFAIMGLCGAACIAVLPRMQNAGRTLLHKLPMPPRFRHKLLGVFDQILSGLRTFHDAGRLSRFAVLTLIIWSSDAMSATSVMRALGSYISLPVVLLLMTGLGLGSALPSTPGYVGIYQFVTVSVLVPFGFSKADAIAYSLLSQAMQYVLIGFWGLLALSRQRGFSFRSISQQRAA